MDLSAHNLQLAFRNSDFVRYFFYYDAIDSTNDKAKALAQAGAREGTLVIADRQTAGRGRSGRTWFSPPGLGIYVSYIFRPELPAPLAFGVHMAVSLGVADAAESARLQGVIGIKWPNDVMAEGRKLAGVLSEVGFQGGELDWCVVGTGININHSRSDFPPSLQDKAVSLKELCHRELARTEVLLKMTEGVSIWYQRLRTEGMDPLVAEWRRRSTVLGRTVRVETAGETYVGTALDLDHGGALRVKLESGAEELLHAGDVHLVQVR